MAEVKEKFGLSSISQDCSGVSGEGLSMASSLEERLIFLFFEEDVLATSCKKQLLCQLFGGVGTSRQMGNKRWLFPSW